MDKLAEEAFKGAPGALLAIILFILPGFIWEKLRALYYAGKHDDDQVLLLECLARSCAVHVATFGSLYIWGLKGGFASVGYVLWAFVVLFVVPIALALLEIRVTEKPPNWFAAVRQWFKIPEHRRRPYPSAWDRAFGRMMWGSYVRVWLENGDITAGILGENSYCGGSDTRDLFLEAVCDLNDAYEVGGPLPGTKGIWIRGDQVKLIEFVNRPV